MSEPLPLEVEVPEGPPVSQDPAWVPSIEELEDLCDDPS
jgi:hypothetical protein